MITLYYNCTFALFTFSFALAGHRGTCLRPLHIFALLCFTEVFVNERIVGLLVLYSDSFDDHVGCTRDLWIGNFCSNRISNRIRG